MLQNNRKSCVAHLLKPFGRASQGQCGGSLPSSSSELRGGQPGRDTWAPRSSPVAEQPTCVTRVCLSQINENPTSLPEAQPVPKLLCAQGIKTNFNISPKQSIIRKINLQQLFPTQTSPLPPPTHIPPPCHRAL